MIAAHIVAARHNRGQGISPNKPDVDSGFGSGAGHAYIAPAPSPHALTWLRPRSRSVEMERAALETAKQSADGRKSAPNCRTVLSRVAVTTRCQAIKHNAELLAPLVSINLFSVPE